MTHFNASLFYPENTGAGLACSFVLNDVMYIAGGGPMAGGGSSRQFSRVNLADGKCGLSIVSELPFDFTGGVCATVQNDNVDSHAMLCSGFDERCFTYVFRIRDAPYSSSL